MASPASTKPLLLKVRVSPSSSKNKLSGYLGEELKISLSAPPVDGKANSALIAFLSKALGLKKADLEIHSGQSSRSKVVKIEGLNKEEADKRLSEILSGEDSGKKS
jgi:uncharacterized protein (TIGR00251 family)